MADPHVASNLFLSRFGTVILEAWGVIPDLSNLSTQVQVKWHNCNSLELVNRASVAFVIPCEES